MAAGNHDPALDLWRKVVVQVRILDLPHMSVSMRHSFREPVAALT